MLTDAELSEHLDPELKSAFIAEAAAMERPAAGILRELVQDFVTKQREAHEHDDCFRAEMEQALRESEEPGAALIANEEIEAEWQVERAALLQRGGRRTA
jgi:hypothetical protein